MLHEQQQTISMRSKYSRMNTRSAREYIMFAPAQFLRNWREQRPSNQGDLYSSVMGEAGRVYYTEMDLLLISFLYRISRLFLSCVLNGTPCSSLNRHKRYEIPRKRVTIHGYLKVIALTLNSVQVTQN
jgi:hypothetical protein